jgi:MFS family permease
LSQLLDDEDLAEADQQLLKLSHIVPILREIFSIYISYFCYIGLFVTGLAFGCFESSLPTYTTDFDGGQSVLTTNLIYSSGSLAFSILTPVVGILSDLGGPSKLLLAALIGNIIIYPLISTMAVSIGGIVAAVCCVFIANTFADSSKYANATEIVDEAVMSADSTFHDYFKQMRGNMTDDQGSLENSEGLQDRTMDDNNGAGPMRVIGFCLVEVAVEGGRATGNVIGKRVYENNGLYGVGVLVAAITGGVVFTLGAIYIAKRLIMGKKQSRNKSSSTNFSTTDQAPVESDKEPPFLIQPVIEAENNPDKPVSSS